MAEPAGPDAPRAQRGAAACDPARLSAYRDGLLEPDERRQVAAHLATCSRCQRTLRSYARLGGALRAQVRAPGRLALGADLRSRLERGSRQLQPRRLAPGLSTLASAVLVAAVGAGIVGTQREALPRLTAPSLVGTVQFEAGRRPEVTAGATNSVDAATASPGGPAEAVRQACVQPLPGAADLLSRRPEVRSALGCATDSARVLGLVSQAFERGELLRRGDTRELLVISDGRWRRYADLGPSAQPVSLALAGSERLELSPWFGRVWIERPEIRALLGQVVAGWRLSQGLVQPFERGFTLWDGRGRMYVVLGDGQAVSFSDRAPALPADPLRPAASPTVQHS